MKLSLKEILKESWKQTKSNYKFLIPLFLLVLVVSFALNLDGDDTFSIFGIISLLVSPVIYYAVTNSSLKISRGEKVGFKSLFNDLTKKRYISFLLVSVVVGLVFVLLAGVSIFLMSFSPLFGGLISLILTVLLAVTLIGVIFFPYYRLIDVRSNFWVAIKDSINLAKGSRLFLIKFIIVASLLNLLGVIALGIGLLITIPVSSIAMAHIYDKLKNKN